MEGNNSGAGVAGNGTGIAGGNSTSRDLAVNGVTSAIGAALPASPGGAGRPAKVAIGFLTRDTDAQFIVDTARIIAGITGNAAFPTPTPTLANVVAARNTYLAAVTAGQDSRLARSLRKKTREALVVLLRLRAHYVEDTSAGDRTVLMSSGFPSQQVRAPVGPLPAPTQVRLVKGKTSGTAIARCSRLGQASAYQWRIAPIATPTAWLPVVTTFAAHAEFDSLTPTTVYVVQVCAVGTAGVGNWSGTAAVLVV
ncbi:MAG TPA: hypothetical protein VGT79_00020 [Xanthomonadaceae bacterium]|nr:hypothetical protein [Xanthomonadaceae bacterium]